MNKTQSIFYILCCLLIVGNSKAQSFSFSYKKPYEDKAKNSYEKKASKVEVENLEKKEPERKIASVETIEEATRKEIKNTIIFNKIKK